MARKLFVSGHECNKSKYHCNVSSNVVSPHVACLITDACRVNIHRVLHMDCTFCDHLLRVALSIHHTIQMNSLSQFHCHADLYA
jgi:hypothetical protein